MRVKDSYRRKFESSRGLFQKPVTFSASTLHLLVRFLQICCESSEIFDECMNDTKTTDNIRTI